MQVTEKLKAPSNPAALASAERRRLISAGYAVVARNGSGRSPKVVDIVEEAGSSIDAFYRLFGSKDALLSAVLDDSMDRRSTELARRMAAVDGPEAKLRVFAESMLEPALAERSASLARALIWNAARVADDSVRRGQPMTQMATLLVEPLGSMGNPDPERDSLLLSSASINRLEEFLWRREVPSSDDIEHLADFCVDVGDRGRAR